MKVVYHNNEWYWGNTTTIITKGCMGTVELQYDNNYPTVAFIKGLSVHKFARKCGIGNTLLELCYQEALKKGMKFLQLNVLQDSWLVKWYERKGFTAIYKDEHEFTMLKSLRPQNRWKPSDLQIEALDSATENCAYSDYQDCLRELIEQLKKL